MSGFFFAVRESASRRQRCSSGGGGVGVSKPNES